VETIVKGKYQRGGSKSTNERNYSAMGRGPPHSYLEERGNELWGGFRSPKLKSEMGGIVRENPSSSWPCRGKATSEKKGRRLEVTRVQSVPFFHESLRARGGEKFFMREPSKE